MTFARRNTNHKSFAYLEGNRPDLLNSWFKRTLEKPMNYKRGEEVAFKERIPLKIGANADPFPPIEATEKITYEVLQALHQLDYPVQMSTKNPAVLLGYIGRFHKPNWSVNVTLTTIDSTFSEIIEPNAPMPSERLDVIRELSHHVPVFVRVQPVIYPKVMEEAEMLVAMLASTHAWGFETEGLKIRTTLSDEEKELYDTISNYVGVNILDMYKKQKVVGGCYVMDDTIKMKYIELFTELAKQYGLKYYVADDWMGKLGEGCECCGTQVLRNYKIWGNNFRTRYWGTQPNESTELGKANINFTRKSERNGTKGKTLDEEMKERYEKARSIFDESC